ncbi:MAG: SLC13 family permease [Anaerolineales bacterium]|nr:MAG: SLC13 family permease [Anaerolineales bacterium]
MTFPQIFVLLVLIVPLVLVFLNRMREDVAALVMAASLGVAQYLGMAVVGPADTPDAAHHALTGFGTPEVIALLSLFIITACLDKYGVTRWIAKKLLSLGGQSERRLIGLFASTAALLSMFMNTLAAGALLLPSALTASQRTGIKPSKLLIPIAYGTMLGGAATYLTTANIIVSGLLRLADPPQQPLTILDFIPTGGFVAIIGLLFLMLVGSRVLPEREPPTTRMDPSNDEMTRTFHLVERMWEAEVTPESAIANKPLSQTRIGETLGMAVLGIHRGSRILSASDAANKIQVGDVLLIVGREERALQLEQAGLRVYRSAQPTSLLPRDSVFAEVIVPPRSSIEGKTLRDLEFRARYGFIAIALWREQRSYRTDVATMKLRAGDILLLMGSPENLLNLKNQHDFVVVEAASNGGELDVPRVAITLVISIGALIALFAGMPVEIAMLTAAVLTLLTGLMKPDEMYQAVKWRAIFLIAGAISISYAMVQTDLAQLFGDGIVRLVAPLGAMGLVAGAYFLSAALTQLMGGQISPLVVAPITISAAIQLGVNPQAVALVTAIAGSISFITPLSHPVNIIMIAPANYTFRDFVKSGWALTIVCFLALMIAVPLFWKL